MSFTDDDLFYSSERFQAFFNKSGQSVLIKANAPHFTILAVSDKYLQIIHKQRSEVLNKNIFDVFPGSATDASERLSVLNSYQKVIDSKTASELEIFKYENFVPALGKNEPQYWSNQKEPILGADGNVTYIIGTNINLSEQALSKEKALADSPLLSGDKRSVLSELVNKLSMSEARFRTLVQKAPVAISIIKGRELIIETANERMLNMLGKNEDIIGKSYTTAIPEMIGQPFVNLLETIFETGEIYYGNESKAMIVRDGVLTEGYFTFIYQPIKDEAGVTTSVMAIATEVTEQVKARKKAEQAEDGLRMAIEAADMGSYHINVIDRVFVPSPRLKEFFGFEPDEEVPYEAAINQIHPDYRQTVAENVEAAIVNCIKFDMEYPVVGHRDGKMRWVRGLGTVQQDSEGLNRYFTGVVHDINERKLEEIRKNDFIGMVSHELKTPLTSLSAVVQVLRLKLKNSENKFVVNGLDRAYTQVKKMDNMINGFLNIVRLESGKLAMNKSDINIDELIKEYVGEVELTVTSHKVIFNHCAPIKVYADGDKIASVLSNLVNNAIKYSPVGTTVEVDCNIRGNEVVVSVKDEGFGISASDIKNLFDRYFRVESKQTEHIAGFGIGLYLSAEIIRLHDGRIWVESEIGKGSVFSFSLPL